MPALIVSCSGHSKMFILDGTTADIGNGVILVTGIDSRFDRFDTILIENGKFAYRCDVDTLTPVVLLFPDGKIEPVFADKSQKSCLFSDSIGKITVEGTIYDLQYREFIPAMQNDTTPEQILHHIDSFISIYPFSEVTPYLIFRYCVMDDAISLNLLSDLIDRMSGQMKDNVFISEVSAGLNRQNSGIRGIGNYPLNDTSYVSYAIGSLFEEDNTLLYVWASWDKASRQIADSLTAIGKRYAKKSFSIAGISIDTDRQRWMTAVREDSVSWNQYNDPKGWNGKIADYFKISRLPYFILLDKTHDNAVIYGNDLDEVVAKINLLPDTKVKQGFKDKKKPKERKKRTMKTLIVFLIAAMATLAASAGCPFAMPEVPVPVFPDRDFVITDFGAKPGVKCTEAIKAAFEACEKAGGGRVVIPDGEWLTGAVHFRSNCNLHLADGATLSFTDDPADYLPVVHTTWEGVECLNYSPLLYAYGCKNIAITGRGLIAPRMDRWREWFSRSSAHMKATEMLYHWCSTNAPLAARDLTKLKDSNFRPHLVQFAKCRDVRIEDIRIRESPFWTIHLFHSENCVVRRLSTFAHGHNNDGVDIEMTRNVLVEDCFFDQGDDGIVIKAGRNQDAWRLNRPTENVVVRNCEFVFAHSLLGIGSELSGGVRNIWMHHCKIGFSYNLLYVKTNRRRGGFVENVWIEDIDTESVRSALFGLKTDVLYQWANFPDYELRYTRIAGINVRNVHARCADWAFDVTADEHLPARGLRFDNVTLDAARKGFSRIVNARDVKFRDVTMGDAEPTEWEQVVNETWHK